MFFSIICPIKGDDSEIFKALDSIVEYVPHHLDFNIVLIHSNCSSDFLSSLNSYFLLHQITSCFVGSPANGVYSAFNLGLDYTSDSKYIFFLGADDFFLSSTPFDYLIELQSLSFDLPKVFTFPVINRSSRKVLISSLGLPTYLFNTLHHQGAIFARSLFNDFAFNNNLRAISDYEFTLRLYSLRVSLLSLSVPSCSVSGVGISNSLPYKALVREFSTSRRRALQSTHSRYFIKGLNYLFAFYALLKFYVFR